GGIVPWARAGLTGTSLAGAALHSASLAGAPLPPGRRGRRASLRLLRLLRVPLVQARQRVDHGLPRPVRPLLGVEGLTQSPVEFSGLALLLELVDLLLSLVEPLLRHLRGTLGGQLGLVHEPHQSMPPENSPPVKPLRSSPEPTFFTSACAKPAMVIDWMITRPAPSKVARCTPSPPKAMFIAPCMSRPPARSTPYLTVLSNATMQPVSTWIFPP